MKAEVVEDVHQGDHVLGLAAACKPRSSYVLDGSRQRKHAKSDFVSMSMVSGLRQRRFDAEIRFLSLLSSCSMTEL